MLRHALKFGLPSAALSVAMIFVTLQLMDTHRLAMADALGYTTIVLGALLVFFGIRSVRESEQGALSFGRGVRAGLAITLISCAVYVAAFEAVYFGFMPGLGQKYATCMVERARQAGADGEKLAQAERQAETFRRLYDQPAWNVALSFAGPFLTGLVASVVSAAILRKRPHRP